MTTILWRLLHQYDVLFPDLPSPVANIIPTSNSPFSGNYSRFSYRLGDKFHDFQHAFTDIYRRARAVPPEFPADGAVRRSQEASFLSCSKWKGEDGQ